MRQPGLGKLDWVKAEKEKATNEAAKELTKENKREKKNGK
jgi:hypothetical protein